MDDLTNINQDADLIVPGEFVSGDEAAASDVSPVVMLGEMQDQPPAPRLNMTRPEGAEFGVSFRGAQRQNTIGGALSQAADISVARSAPAPSLDDSERTRLEDSINQTESPLQASVARRALQRKEQRGTLSPSRREQAEESLIEQIAYEMSGAFKAKEGVAGTLLGSVASFENVGGLSGLLVRQFPALASRPIVTLAADAALTNTLTDPVVQGIRLGSGAQEEYDLLQTALAPVVGAAVGGALGGAGVAVSRGLERMEINRALDPRLTPEERAADMRIASEQFAVDQTLAPRADGQSSPVDVRAPAPMAGDVQGRFVEPTSAFAVDVNARVNDPQMALTFGKPGIMARGPDADNVKKQWRTETPYDDINAMLAAAPGNQKAIGDAGRQIADELGVEFRDPGVKANRDRILQKMGDKKPGTLTDIVRSGFDIKTPEQADAIIDRLAQRFEVIDEGWFTTVGGYFDRKLYVRFPDGMIGEVQMWPPGLFKAKEFDGGHKLYEAMRVLPEDDYAGRAKLTREMEDFYAPVLAALPSDWRNAISGGGIAGRSSAPNLVENASGVSTRASLTQEGSGDFQTPSSKTRAVPANQTSGSPSNEPNFQATDIGATSNRNIAPSPAADNTTASSQRGVLSQASLIGQPVAAIPAHRVSTASGTSIDVAPIVMEADALRTSSDAGYDATLQPRDRDRAASQAQIRDIASRLDPERLGFSAEADRGAPIVGNDGMVESGNGRVLAIRRAYEQGGDAAVKYRAWLSSQGVDLTQYREPILVRQRLTDLAPEQRQAFTVEANQAATLTMSAGERAMSDARMLKPETLDLIRNANDLGAQGNRDFTQAFIRGLPQSEQGMMATADGALSSEGLTRIRNAVLAKAYSDADLMARIAEATSDDIKSISNALIAAAPDWARFRSDVDAGVVRPDMDLTPSLMEAVKRSADLRAKGTTLDAFLRQQDAFDSVPAPVEAWMRMFYQPDGKRAAGGPAMTERLRAFAQEARKVTADDGLGFDLPPVRAEDVQALAARKGASDAARETTANLFESRRPSNGPSNGADGAEAGRPATQESGRGLEPQSNGGNRDGAGNLAAQDTEIAPRVELREPDVKKASDAHRGTSHTPEKRGQQEVESFRSDVETFRTTLAKIAETPEQVAVATRLGDEYHNALLTKLESIWSTRSGVASAMIAGPAKFKQTTKANNAYEAKVKDLVEWQKKQIKDAEKTVKGLRTEGQQLEENWKSARAALVHNINVIRGIDSNDGPWKGFNRPTFVNSTAKIIRTLDERGQPQNVKRALDFVREAQAAMDKPIFTAKHPAWKLEPADEMLPEALARRGGNAVTQKPLANQLEAGRPKADQGTSPAADAKVTRLEDISRQLVDSFETIARTGRVQPGARGIYKTRSGVVRVRSVSDFDTLAHEVGHALHLGGGAKSDFDAIVRANVSELQQFGAGDGAQGNAEGFANLFHAYVTNLPFAQMNYPNATAALDTLMRSRFPEQMKAVEDVRQMLDVLHRAPSLEVVRSDQITTQPPKFGDRFRELVAGDKDPQGRVVYSALDSLYTQSVDSNHPVYRAVENLANVAKANGKPVDLKPLDDAYILARRLPGSHGRADAMLKYGVVPAGKVSPEGPSLSSGIEKALGKKWDASQFEDFGAYLTARRMVAEYQRFFAGQLERPPGKLSLSDYQKAVADFEAANPSFKAGADDIYVFQKNHLKRQFDKGLVTKEYYETAIQRADYVPAMRDMRNFEDTEAKVPGVSAGGQGLLSRTIMKRFRGSDRPVINPLESIFKRVHDIEFVIARNDSINALARLADEAGPGAGFIYEDIPSNQLKGQRVDVMEALKSAGKTAGLDSADLTQMMLQVEDVLGDSTWATIFRQEPIKEGAEPIIYRWVNGERRAGRLGDDRFARELHHALTAMSDYEKDFLTTVLAMASGILRTGITKSPDFILTNAIRDQSTAMLTAGRKYIPFVSMAKGLIEAVKKTDEAIEFAGQGGLAGGAIVEAIQSSAFGRNVKSLQGGNWFGEVLKAFEISETGTRLGLYKSYIEQAKAMGFDDENAALYAAFKADDYIDFRKHGAAMGIPRRIFTFLNAAIQGTDREVRAAGDWPVLEAKRARGETLTTTELDRLKDARIGVLRLATMGVVLGSGLAFLNSENENVQNASKYWKDTNFLFSVNGTDFAIPKGFGVVQSVVNLFERGAEFSMRGDPTIATDWLEGMAKAFMMPASNPALTLMYDLPANYDRFRDRNIVPYYMQGWDAPEQYSKYTSSLARQLSAAANMVGVKLSPMKVDYTIQQLGGGMARDALFGWDVMMGTDRPEKQIYDYPVLRRFVKNLERGSRAAEDFNKLVGEKTGSYEQAENAFRGKINNGERAAASEYLRNLKEDERAWVTLNTLGFDTKAKQMHPMLNARERVALSNGMVRQLVNGNVIKEDDLDRRDLTRSRRDAEPIPLTPRERALLQEEFLSYSVATARNAMVTVGAKGTTGLKPMDATKLVERIRIISPAVADEFTARMERKNLPSAETTALAWPEMKRRLLVDGENADLDDLIPADVKRRARRRN
jgi:hypothetical protein